jgi:hypothetical protein
MKYNAMRGGVLEHVYRRNVPVGQVAHAVVDVDFTYEEGPDGPFTPVVRDVVVENVTSGKSEYALYLRGFPNAPITDVTLRDCHFRNVAKGNLLENVRDVHVEDATMNGKPMEV